MKFRPPALWLLAGPALLLVLLGWEFHWRYRHELLKPQAPSPDAALVAEVRSLPGSGDATGVFVRGRWAWLRSVQPQLVFTGQCDGVETRWFGQARLVIECELRSGEPRLLRERIDGVMIEVIVQRRFA
jgi:hypothetical protein